MATKTRFTNLFFEREIEKSVRISKKEILEILRDLRDGRSCFTYLSQTVTATPADFPRILVEWSRSSEVDQSLKNIIVSALLSAEEKNAGSGLLAAGMWASNENSVNLDKRASRAFYDDVMMCLKYFGGTGMARTAAQAAVNLGGLGHQIEFLETSENSTKLEVIEGKEILGSVDPLFGDRIGYEHVFKDCVVVAIDGIVETVSSVHRILEESQSRTILVLAKSFLPDVSSTMAATWEAGKGKCLPFVVSSWQTDNFLSLETSSIKCVSHERGDIISSASSQNLDETTADVKNSQLILRCNNGNDRSKIIVKVSKSLGGLTGVAMDRIKILVGYARSASRSGVIKWEDLSNLSKNLSDLYSRDLAVPSSSLAGASRVNQSLTKILQSLGCLITLKEGEKL